MRLENYVGDIRTRYETLVPVLDERARRWWAATEARSLGHGGILCVAAATGMSRTTVRAGLMELERGITAGRIRRPGAGRRTLTAGDPDLIKALERLVDPATRGDPMWTYWRSCGYREGRRERDSAAAEVNHGHECTG